MMARRSLKPRPVQMRNVLLELPEDKVLALSAKARASGVSVHVLAAGILVEWLGAK